MIKGFKEFILRGNVIDLAVAVVIGAAFTAVVNAIVEKVFNPLIGALFKADSLDNAWVIKIPTLDPNTPAEIGLGAVAGALIQFLIVAVVVYFAFVLPINHFKKKADALLKTQPSAEEPEEIAPDLALLAEIRDLLANANPEAAKAAEAAAAKAAGKHAGDAS
ncbi:large conductance mechanosensitive channel protein MscL [Mycetocola spongiae]|uniref:large conductance mechanosensitive channel protein MscL n=1 Tax=Mycetocola spongiae TaxID=2859226 RepID=UPI001CF436BA|nr:large conductance mechanosensitive channel protein MscL [Mycetocola spongiae]UCR88853.1 large conductance mechanosensitive channel protein MscL [Mycetocola spongiae]